MRWSACFAAIIALIGLALALYLLQGAGAL
jgi:hypothetical protein